MSKLTGEILERARPIAAEYDGLREKLNLKPSQETRQRFKFVSRVVEALEIWDDEHAEYLRLAKVLQKAGLEREEEAQAQADLERTRTDRNVAFDDLVSALAPKNPFAHLPCFLEIRPGIGGDEAKAFAADLVRMYRSYLHNQGLHYTVLKYEDADSVNSATGGESSITEAILEVKSEGAYDRLESEAGVHRVQRVPATDSKGRTHTSTASVMVLPAFPAKDDSRSDWDDPASDYYVDPKVIHNETMTAGGPGGQHVNKTQSAVRLTHLPTKVTVVMRVSRSQHENKREAWRLIRSRIAESRRQAREDEALKLRRATVGPGKWDRGDKIRTYNWGHQRVTDHRISWSATNLGDVLEGGEHLGRIMSQVRAWKEQNDALMSLGM